MPTVLLVLNDGGLLDIESAMLLALDAIASADCWTTPFAMLVRITEAA